MLRACCALKPVNFRQRAKTKIVIESLTESIDDYGTPIKTFSPLLSTFAIVESKQLMSNLEYLQFSKLTNELIYQIIIRYKSSLLNLKTTAGYRLKIPNYSDSVYLNILNIKNVQEDLKSFGKIYQIITAKEGEEA